MAAINRTASGKIQWVLPFLARSQKLLPGKRTWRKIRRGGKGKKTIPRTKALPNLKPRSMSLTTRRPRTERVYVSDQCKLDLGDECTLGKSGKDRQPLGCCLNKSCDCPKAKKPRCYK
jgi:hypothetical protein